MNYTKARFDPIKKEYEVRFLTPGDQNEYSNNFRTR